MGVGEEVGGEGGGAGRGDEEGAVVAVICCKAALRVTRTDMQVGL